MDDSERTVVMRPERPEAVPPKPVFRSAPPAEKPFVPAKNEAAEPSVPPVRPENRSNSAESQFRPVSFHGSGKTLFGISLVNGLLSIITLGIYFFWGKVKARRYLYSEVEFNQERFSYHGTGGELLIGYLKAAVVFGGLMGITMAANRFFPPLRTATSIAFWALVAFALFGSMRYAMSRTAWRDLRFSLRGDFRDFLKMYVIGIFLTGLTLGIYLPYFRNNLRNFWVNHIWIGNAPFEYDGEGKDLLSSYLIAVLLLIPTLGLSLIGYLAKEQRYQWDHTRLAGGRFSSTITGTGMIGLMLVNLVLLVLTAGLAYPWVRVRNLRYTLDHLAVEGPMDLESIGASPQPETSAMGEGLTEIMDVGVSLG